MEKSNRTIIVAGVIVLVLIVALLVFANQSTGGPGKYDAFAACLKDKGAVFYGAFWCPHCQNQKAMFGSSEKYLPYIECSNPDGQSQNGICNAEGIRGYPTWVFPDKSTTTGEVPLATLAEKTGCTLPK